MALQGADKIRILKMLRTKAIDEILYSDFLGSSRKSKVLDIDVLTFLIDTLIKELEKEEKASENFIKKLIAYIIKIHDVILKIKNQQITDVILISKMKSLFNKYNNYVERFNLEKEGELWNLFADFDKAISEQYKVDEVTEDNKNSSLEIVNLLLEIEKLKKEVNDSAEKIKNLETELELSDKHIRKKDLQIGASNTDINKRDNEIRNLNKQIENNLDSIKELEKVIRQKDEYIASLEETRSLYNELCLLHENVTKQLEECQTLINLYKQKEVEYNRKLIVEVTIENRKQQIENLLIKFLIKEKCTINDLIQKLSEEGMEVSENELNDILKRVKRKMNIINPSILTFPPVFNACPPNVLTDSVFDISSPLNGCMDILLTSDFHIREMSSDVIADLDKLYDYAVANNVSLVLNLGDFFESKGCDLVRYKGNFDKFMIANDEVINKYPKVPGVYNATMGGNHDRDVLRFGVDPIKRIADAREDFIYLGYDNATINLGLDNKISLHHPSVRYTDPLVDANYQSQHLMQAIEDYYQRVGINRDDVYIDLFGHMHYSRLDAQNGVCVVPSYFRNRLENGAWHLKIYFENGKISQMVFIPLIVNKKLLPVTEFSYQKRLIKQ